MKMKIILLLVVLTSSLPGKLEAQGSFQNLDFEQADVAGLEPGWVPAARVLPGWVAYMGQGGSPWDQVLYNRLSGGGQCVSIHDASSLRTPIEGNYSAMLQGQFNPGNVPGLASVAIGQTGVIPAGARSLRFYSGALYIQVTVAGNEIPLVELQRTPGYIVFGGDISSYAGQTVELKFTRPSRADTGYSSPYLDAFSSRRKEFLSRRRSQYWPLERSFWRDDISSVSSIRPQRAWLAAGTGVAIPNRT